MKAEILAVGTELLMGQIVNSNAAVLSRKLAEIGVHVYYHAVVGDNPGRIREAIRLASERSDLVICTGGLGPTEDDLTKDVLAAWSGRSLYVDETAKARLEAHFRERGIDMVASNIKQAMTIEGADVLPNDNGLAVGVGLTHADTHFVLLPGPPREMLPMYEQYAVPWIRGKFKGERPLHSVMLKFAGIGESNLEHALMDVIHGQSDPTVAPYAKEGEVTLRVTTAAETAEEAGAKIRPVIDRIRAIAGDYLYAEEEIPLEQAVVAKLAAHGKTLVSAESCTGGLFGELITSIPGSSAVYKGGVITYDNAWKREYLNVPAALLEGAAAPGAVSAETAEAMAAGLLAKSGADAAVAITGVAGPAHSERKPVGLVYTAIAVRGGGVRVEKLQLKGDREKIRLRTVKHLLFRLWEWLEHDAGHKAQS